MAPPFLWSAIAENPHAYLKPTSIPSHVVLNEDGTLDRESLCKLYSHIFDGQELESPPFGFLSQEEILKRKFATFATAVHCEVY